ncbi:MAG: sensor histidine kinase [Armatimonadota bacterium]
MASKRPPLLRHLLRQHLVAASITLGLMLLVALFLADHLALRAAAYTLAQEIHVADVQTLQINVGLSRGGRMILDSAGKPFSGMGGMHGNGRGPGWRQMSADTAWSLTPTVLARGEMQGTGALPWVPHPVVWAARTVTDTTGDTFILIVWNRTSAVRGAAQMTYLLVIAAIGLAFLVSMGFLVQTVRKVTHALTDVTTAGRQMVGGDFAVAIPPQATAELDDLSTVVTDLASHLDQTISDLHAEHARLLRLEHAQRQFVADASHEMRAPLGAMAITLDAWHDGLLAPHERPEAVTHLRDEVKRLGRMVTQLLDLSRIESGRQPLALIPLDLHDISIQVVDTMASLPGAPITLEMPADLPQVIADRDAVHRILRNLLENARRFTPADGEIRLWASTKADGVHLGVTDTGCGIPAAVRQRVWDRFARAERERAGDDTGTGLGLAIVKALAEAMGGDVGLTSTEGAGTTAWVRLPTEAHVSEASVGCEVPVR